jgi:hypothetical protein
MNQSVSQSISVESLCSLCVVLLLLLLCLFVRVLVSASINNYEAISALHASETRILTAQVFSFSCCCAD